MEKGGRRSEAKNCFYALAFSMCVSLRVPFDLLALLFSTCDSDTLELVIGPPTPYVSCPATSCASLSILLLCAQIVRHDRKSLSHAAAALDATPTASPFGFLASSNKCSDSADTHTHTLRQALHWQIEFLT